MPELPEVNRAAGILRRIAMGKSIASTRVQPDPIVFADGAQDQFNALIGRQVKSVERLGKNFYVRMTLDGKGPNPVFHFGMSGSCQSRNGNVREGMVYGTSPKKGSQLNEEGEDWPPKYWKVVLQFDDGTDWAFCDARRLGRIKLINAEDPTQVPPLSLLGADPVLALPTIQTMAEQLAARTAPIKAALLDQNGIFSGIGNWMADEILFQALVHPSQPCCSLTATQVSTLRTAVSDICRIACEVDADSSKFPADWLFAHRWSKGRKGKAPSFVKDGQTVTIKFETVGGRTSAVTSLQKLVKQGINLTPTRKRTVAAAVETEAPASVSAGPDEKEPPKKRTRSSRRTAAAD